MSDYSCKACGAPASIGRDGTIRRTCEHTGTVVMRLDVVCRGESSLADMTAKDRAVAMFRRLGGELLQRMRGHGVS